MTTISKAIGRVVLLWLHVGVGPMIGMGPMDGRQPAARAGRPASPRDPRSDKFNSATAAVQLADCDASIADRMADVEQPESASILKHTR